MSNDKMREEFEVWARKMSMDLEYRNIPGIGQFYECPITLMALEAWQASREEMVIDFSQLKVQHASYNNVDCYAISDVGVILKRSGVKVKS